LYTAIYSSGKCGSLAADVARSRSDVSTGRGGPGAVGSWSRSASLLNVTDFYRVRSGSVSIGRCTAQRSYFSERWPQHLDVEPRWGCADVAAEIDVLHADRNARDLIGLWRVVGPRDHIVYHRYFLVIRNLRLSRTESASVQVLYL